MRSTRRGTVRRLTTGAVLGTLLVAGCGGADEETTTGAGATPTTVDSPTPTPSPTETPTEGGPAETLTVTESEFKIDGLPTTLTAGSYTFTVQNSGKFPHDLKFKGPDGQEQGSPIIQGGQSGQATVTLQPGEYEVWCSVGKHREQGMDLKVMVS